MGLHMRSSSPLLSLSLSPCPPFPHSPPASLTDAAVCVLAAGTHLHTRTHACTHTQHTGKGAFGVVKLAINKKTGAKDACKSISKAKLVCKEDVKDVQAEVAIMNLVAGHPHVVSLKVGVLLLISVLQMMWVMGQARESESHRHSAS